MTKRFANTAFIYAIVAVVFGVFYREFTKWSGFTGKTNLSVMHAHYLMLGVFFFLILMLVEKSFALSAQKHIGALLITYQVGLNITGLGFFMRGVTQVLEMELSRGLDASISGIAGIGHIFMGVSFLMILWKIKKQAG